MVVIDDSVYYAEHSFGALFHHSFSYVSFVLLFVSSLLHFCAHAFTSAAFAAVHLGADDSQLLLAWIAMRIPFPIGAPVH